MNALQQLTSTEFLASLGSSSTAAGLRLALSKSKYVREVRTQLNNRQIKDAAIRRFVDQLMAEFVPGQRFKFDVTLAAFAVALETRYTSFADEYLIDLARLAKKVEFEYSPSVARLCRVAWGEKKPRIIMRTKQVGHQTPLDRGQANWDKAYLLVQIRNTRVKGLVFFSKRMSHATS